MAAWRTRYEIVLHLPQVDQLLYVGLVGGLHAFELERHGIERLIALPSSTTHTRTREIVSYDRSRGGALMIVHCRDNPVAVAPRVLGRRWSVSSPRRPAAVAREMPTSISIAREIKRERSRSMARTTATGRLGAATTGAGSGSFLPHKPENMVARESLSLYLSPHTHTDRTTQAILLRYGVTD